MSFGRSLIGVTALCLSIGVSAIISMSVEVHMVLNVNVCAEMSAVLRAPVGKTDPTQVTR